MAFGKKKAEGSGFVYKPRSADTVRARATASGNREGFIADGVKTYTPKAGSHTVRILPPTWEDAEHYGYDIHAHYNVGHDGGAYLCLHKMKEEECAICDERQQALKNQDEELEQALRPRKRVACWVIDRDNERDGPMLWMMPWTLDTEIVKQSIDKKTGEVYNLDDPTEGYDVSFERQGDGPTTKYVGVQLDRRPSPLHEDEDDIKETLKFIKDNPVPDQLVFQEGQYLTDLVGDGLTLSKRDKGKTGKGKDKDEKDDEKPAKKPERPQLRKRGDDADEDDKKGKKKPAKEEEDDDDFDASKLTYEDVQGLNEEELTALAEAVDVDISDVSTEKEAADLICEKLDLEAPKKESPLRGKLAGLKKKLGK